MKSRFFLFYFFLFTCRLFAQHDTIVAPGRAFYVGVSGHYGFVWVHRANMAHLVQKHLVAGEIDFSKTTTGNKSWHQPFHYPDAGLAVHVIPLGNPQQLGTAIGVYPYINFPLGNKQRDFKLYIRYGWGVGWITKKFDPIDNHKNIAIGSHLNTCFSLRFTGKWTIDESNLMEFSLGMTHFSNGKALLPNLGLNLPLVSIGYHHLICSGDKWQHTPMKNDVADRGVPQINRILADRTWHFSTFLVFGFNDVEAPGGRRFGVANVLTYASKQIARRTKLGGGIDVMYSQAVRRLLADDSVYVTKANSIQLGVKASYELVLGRVSLPFELGYYVHNPDKVDGPDYCRLGVRYLVCEHLVIDLSLKTHRAKAEYWELGAGWRF